jgi:hypothetical protein
MYQLTFILVSYVLAVTPGQYEKLCLLGTKMLPYYPSNESVSLLRGCNGSCPSFAVCSGEVISLTIQFISGPLPTNLDIFSKLESLTIKSTLTSGVFPTSLCNLNSLTRLVVASTPLRGTIPNCILSPQLNYLDLSNNLFSGTFPNYIPSPITQLYLNNNLFTGQLPNLPYQLIVGSFSYNAFSSGLDQRITQASNLMIFYGNNNRFSGTIPEDVVSGKSLFYLSLSNNRLEGQIPYISSELKYLDLAYNEYTSVNQTIKFTALGYPWITQIDLRGNRLSNPVPKDKYLLDTQDLDECSLFRYVCPDNGYCSDGWNPKLSYTCSCQDGYVLEKDLCQDVNECLNTNACESGACVNVAGSYFCCPNNLYNPTPLVLNASCKSCYTNYTYIMNSNPETGLENISSYLKCFGKCSDGTAYRNRISTSLACPAESVSSEYCQYPCLGLDTTDIPPRLVIEMLYTEVTRGKYLEELAGIINVSVLQTFDISTLRIKCQYNSSKVIKLINSIVTRGLTVTQINQTVTVSVITSSHFKLEAVIFGILGFAVTVSSLGLVIFLHYRTLTALPDQVADEIRPSILMRCCWNYQGDQESGYYYTNCSDIPIDLSSFSGCKVQKIYNKVLVNNFVGAYEVQKARFGNKAFCSKSWNSDIARHSTYTQYQQVANSFTWNEEGYPDILLMCHGTQYGLAKAICQTGFASLAKLDAGWYGKGIYFTSYPCYTIQYTGSINPSIIVSYVIPGNVYPVIEESEHEDNLVGKPIKSGYQSNYVRVSAKGHVGTDYDELVIASESQILPLYIVNLNQDELAEMATTLVSQYIKLS